MAVVDSQDWRQVRRFVKLVRRSVENQVFRAFSDRFGQDLDWFLRYPNLYRDVFVEHPEASSPWRAFGVTRGGVQIAGLTGSGLSRDGEDTLARLREELAGISPELKTMTPSECYVWLLNNLEHLSKDQFEGVKPLLCRVGMPSPEPISITKRLATLYAGFVEFALEITRNSGT